MKTKGMLVMLAMLVCLGFRSSQRIIHGKVSRADTGTPLAGVTVSLKGTPLTTATNGSGLYQITVPDAGGILIFSSPGLQSQEIKTGSRSEINVVLALPSPPAPLAETIEYERKASGVGAKKYDYRGEAMDETMSFNSSPGEWNQPKWNTEEYDAVNENIFHEAIRNPLSTFSIDVDAASYSNVRRFLQNGQTPPVDAVRIEEMINYFRYDYDEPSDGHPFAIHTQISTAPWNTAHKLISIGLQGKRIPTDNLPPSNLVFLIDVSGSMSDYNKLPLLKSSFKMLVNELRPQDHVAIVVYAGAAGLVLEPTSGGDKEKIINALDKLEAGGSTAGGEGINLAYAIAKEHFKKEGNNRIILATDGDFNVGASSNGEMERMIEEKRKDGIFLTVLGFGMGNYKDSKMEILADKGNGNYAYIDNILEAKKVLVSEFGGTLFTIAKDVKLQIEFNPARVKAYRLIGYENRVLKNEDFNNDKKDAGELGSGHTVTALYEIIPAGSDDGVFTIDELKYQNNRVGPQVADSNELMTIKFRYKNPNEETSKLIVHPVVDRKVDLLKTSDNFRWAASVAAFGMMLRKSEFILDYSQENLLRLAQGAKGKDEEGYRIEFINMIKATGSVARK